MLCVWERELTLLRRFHRADLVRIDLVPPSQRRSFEPPALWIDRADGSREVVRACAGERLLAQWPGLAP